MVKFMSSQYDDINNWHKDEREWWDKNGDYMTYQWKLTPTLHKVIRSDLESDYIDYLLHPGGRLLDLGCGSGWLSTHFAINGMSVLGIDVSQEQINAANEIKIGKGLNCVEFTCADFIDWDCNAYLGYFNSVFVSAFIHHLPDAEFELLIEKISSIVSPGGRVYMYEPLMAETSRRHAIKLLDLTLCLIQKLLLNKLPIWFGFMSPRHVAELARGYTTSSPHEHPVNIRQIERFCGDSFIISEVRGWHLHSLSFSMRVTALTERAKRFYEPVGRVLYQIDQLLFRWFGWETFSSPDRFILCSIKLTRK
jgi:2-polyprenyl-3-methyl-5-hydroxy-6-metoxy-1,4-benzoquinol methylase